MRWRETAAKVFRGGDGQAMVTRPGGGSSQQAPPAQAAPVLVSAPADTSSGLRRQLLQRMSVAGVVILALLGVLAVLEYSRTPDDPMAGSPQFTEPVPVRRREPAAPMKPTETPPLLEQAAGPQASGAALEQPRPPTEASAAASSEGASGAAAAAAEKVPMPVVPRLLAGPTLQSSVLADQRRAEELQAKLAHEGIPSSVETRLQVGPFRTRAEAEAARRKMQSLGIDGFSLLGKNSKP